MASNIDPTQPPQGEATTEAVRGNFLAAKNEIEALQSATTNMAAMLAGTEPITAAIIGDPGTEGNGINYAGTTYNSKAKISDIGPANPALVIVHRHSTTLPPLTITARSYSNDETHVSVPANTPIYSDVWTGWAGNSYKAFASLDIKSKVGSTPSETNSPGSIALNITPVGSTVPVPVLTADATLLTANVPIAVPASASGNNAPRASECFDYGYLGRGTLRLMLNQSGVPATTGAILVGDQCREAVSGAYVAGAQWRCVQAPSVPHDEQGWFQRIA